MNNNLDFFLEQPISVHPHLPHIQRKVVIYSIKPDYRFKQIVIDAEMRYFDQNQEGKDVTAGYNHKLTDWIVNNKDYTTVRDLKGQPVPNPDYVAPPTEGEDTRTFEQRQEFKRLPSADYFLSLIKNEEAPNLVKLLRMHIVQNDAIKFFDKLLNII